MRSLYAGHIGLSRKRLCRYCITFACKFLVYLITIVIIDIVKILLRFIDAIE